MSATSQQQPASHAVPSYNTHNLQLDPSIRDWVVLPLLVIMISAGLLRTYLGQYLRAKSRKVDPIESRSRNVLQRAKRLATGGGGYLDATKWEARRRYYAGEASVGVAASEKGGYLREEADWAEESKARAEQSGDGLDAMNPMAAMEGMKGQMAFMVQNMVMMQGISHFFHGYVIIKIPFHLTLGFKQMFQRGLDLTTLDTSYVSSVSWYFLVMFGLRAFFRLVVGDPTPDVQQSALIQHDLGRAPGAAPVGPQQFDAKKALTTEADNLELARVKKSMLDDAERRLLGKRYPKRKLGSSAGGSKSADAILGLGGLGGSKGKVKRT
mmetsp:Transcript_3805/g.8305  ORF Transcript_3805/g.8305 Transcript_3805/m.8305 type:complete len:325 (+) Transcript_3805:267-1241(+)